MFGIINPFSGKSESEEKRIEQKKEKEKKENDLHIEGREFFVNIKKMSPSALIKNHTEIKVSKVAHIPGGFLSFAYIEVTIETLPFEWKVKRKEEDILKFKDYIQKVFPQYVLPPLFKNSNTTEKDLL